LGKGDVTILNANKKFRIFVVISSFNVFKDITRNKHRFFQIFDCYQAMLSGLISRVSQESIAHISLLSIEGERWFIQKQ